MSNYKLVITKAGPNYNSKYSVRLFHDNYQVSTWFTSTKLGARLWAKKNIRKAERQMKDKFREEYLFDSSGKRVS